ncbi:hypothetical protein GCM10010401_05670 [Rarobacter faecitabidus]
MHPATPLVKMWLVVLALVVFALREFADSAIEGSSSDVSIADLARNLTAWAVLGVVVIVVGGGMYLSWRMTRFSIGDGALQVRSGILFRKHVTTRLERIEAIDIRRPLGARVLGLAELQIETAGGDDSKVELGYFKVRDATDLRAVLVSGRGTPVSPSPLPPSPLPGGATSPLASGGPSPLPGSATSPAPPYAQPSPRDGHAIAHESVAEGPGLAAPIPPEPGHIVPASGKARVAGPLQSLLPGDPEAGAYADVVRIPVARIVTMALLGPGAIITYLIAAGLVTGALITQRWGALGFIVPVAWGFVAQTFGVITGDGGYRATLSGSNLRISRGLTDHTSQSVPTDRIHAIAVTQGLIARAFGWWTVEATIAGYDRQKSQRALLPYGTPAQIRAFLAALSPYWERDRSQELLAHAMTGTRRDGSSPFTATPPSARLWEPLAFARTGIVVDDGVAFLRSGRIARRATVAWLDHCQSVTVVAGPFDRRAGVASLVLDLVTGPVSPSIDHLAQADATTIRDHCAVAAGHGRPGRNGTEANDAGH